MAVLTTAAVRPKDRFAYWREVVSQHFVHLRPERVGGARFRGGEIDARRLGPLSISQVTSGGQRVFRTRIEIARSPVPLYFMNIQTGGTGSFRQGGDELALARGDIFFVDPLREFELGCEQPFRHLSLKLPREWLEGRLARPEALPGAVIRREHPLARILQSYVLNGFETAARIGPATAAIIAEHVVGLAADALRETGPHDATPSRARRDASFVHACRMIALNCGDPELRPASIARVLAMPERTLHALFADHGETVMKRVLEERVRRAATLLATPEAAHRSITEIGLACGFNDMSHFARTFAARMGLTPSRWRKQRD
jgi:AraC family transcriptional regulator, positive regulator of tynA and feaB